MAYIPVTTTQTGTYGNGYTCSRCGTWVGYNTSHYCGGTAWVQPFIYVQNQRLSDEDVERIAQRVAELIGGKRRKKG